MRASSAFCNQLKLTWVCGVAGGCSVACWGGVGGAGQVPWLVGAGGELLQGFRGWVAGREGGGEDVADGAGDFADGDAAPAEGGAGRVLSARCRGPG